MTTDQLMTVLKVKADKRPVVEAMQAGALAAVQRATDWYFGPPRLVSEWLTTKRIGSLYLRQPPIPPESLVLQRRTGSLLTDLEIVDPADYEVQGRRVRHFEGLWYPYCAGALHYKATYLEGFVEIPADVQQLIAEVVSGQWGRAGKTGIQSESLGDYSYSLGDLRDMASWSGVVGTWRRGRI